MEVIVLKSYFKDLKKLPKKVIADSTYVLETLANAENLQTSELDYIKLSGQKSDEKYYRIRIGDYRIGCELIKPKVILITIFHRQDDYKSFP